MEYKELKKRDIRSRVGWVYSDLEWLTKEEATLVNKTRGRLLKSLSGRVHYSFMQNKIHIGNLSPGCLICGEGYWSCIYINTLCTANCFYCPQDRNIQKECLPYEKGIIFYDSHDYVDYLEKFGYKGVGFSGGETLLVFERLLEYIKNIRKRFGKRMYLWIYTNGDLVDRSKLDRLKQAGLDEIRFNISARDYNLKALRLATKIIDTVTVEIPAIPEDLKILKKCLFKIHNMGVKYLNIHQLITSENNYKNYLKRGYTFLHQPNIAILESEITALKLIKYALNNKINLAINYCTGLYADRLQSAGRRMRLSSLVKDNFEELTNSGYIRRISVQDSAGGVKNII